MNKKYDEDGVKPVTPLYENQKDNEADIEPVTPLSKNQKDAVEEVQASTAEYSNLFEERRSVLTTELPSEIEFRKKSNEELDEGDAKSVTPLPKNEKDTEGIDYSDVKAHEELLTEVGLFLADDYTALKKKNKNLVKLFSLLKEKKLTFTQISNDSAQYPEESKLVKEVFKTSFTIEQAKQADEIIQRKVFNTSELEKNLDDLLQMQKKKGEPDFESHEQKRISGLIKPGQPEKEEKQRSSEMKEPSWMREFLRSILRIGRALAKIFTPEKIEIKSNPIYESKEVYERSQRQDHIVHYNKAKDEVTITKIDDQEVSSELEDGSIKKVSSKENSKKERGPG